MADEYTPKNILITGGCGFIASHVVLHLAKKYDYKIIVLDKLDYCSARGHLTELDENPNFRFVHGNILSADLVSYLLRQEEIDTVMHYAASTHVDNSFGSSISFTENNVMGTHVMLECCRTYGKVKRFLHVSTDEVYGGETSMENEEAALAPTNPYACSKAAAELICRAYVKSFNMPILITRGNNVYGPHQFPDKLIPKSICLLNNKQPCFIHGDGSHIRNFLHAEDAARAFDAVLHKGKLHEFYNVGTEFERTTIEVVRDLLSLFGLSSQEKEYMEFVRDRAFNDVRYSIDTSKVEALGWKPEIPWMVGLAQTREWYLNEKNLDRWPHWRTGLTAHPSLDKQSETFQNATDHHTKKP
eukprot:NODE_2645_length_1372_cov_102.664532_g2513_i0.p1 GENE.NODE_2645_length_1372_cov_102.664532_g2513_i0~~NODE_2645_length_1372_cov_102.664532_g2513_i0.p1  ORF type:complete len:358 (-),score=98.01 NODE_2645_length_1372_cov_102.664532_g2513_i0:237-1310(-)